MRQQTAISPDIIHSQHQYISDTHLGTRTSVSSQHFTAESTAAIRSDSTSEVNLKSKSERGDLANLRSSSLPAQVRFEMTRSSVAFRRIISQDSARHLLSHKADRERRCPAAVAFYGVIYI